MPLLKPSANYGINQVCNKSFKNLGENLSLISVQEMFGDMVNSNRNHDYNVDSQKWQNVKSEQISTCTLLTYITHQEYFHHYY